jgi:hypothetical protein
MDVSREYLDGSRDVDRYYGYGCVGCLRLFCKACAEIVGMIVMEGAYKGCQSLRACTGCPGVTNA